MDNERFDSIAKLLALKVPRRAATVALTALAPLALARPEGAAKKKRKKKRCRLMQQPCGGSNGCCDGLHCGANGCAGGDVCHHDEGGACSDDCDCGGDLACSERYGYTCQYCSYPETECVWTDECCLETSICGDNGCGSGHAVCCQWEIGSLCYDDCDCCAESAASATCASRS